MSSLTKNTNIKTRLAKSSWSLVGTHNGCIESGNKSEEEFVKKGPFVIILEG